MTIKAGDKMPEGTFTRMTGDGPQKITTEQLFAAKTVVLFSVPGAFTPTCDAKHLPGFVELADQIKAKGVDTIACTAVNDVFVMNAWGKHGGVGDYQNAVTAINRGVQKGQIKHLDEAYVYLGRSYVQLKNTADAKKAFTGLKTVPNINPRVLKLWELYSEKLGS